MKKFIIGIVIFVVAVIVLTLVCATYGFYNPSSTTTYHSYWDAVCEAIQCMGQMLLGLLILAACIIFVLFLIVIS